MYEVKEGKGQCEVQNVELVLRQAEFAIKVDEEQGSGGSERKPKYCGKYCGFSIKKSNMDSEVTVE